MWLKALNSILAVFLEAAPFVLIGLLLAGWMKVLLRARSVEKYLGQSNLKSALYAWIFGVPLPVCSCGVVPLSLSLRQKRASREALLAFLLGTPETSVGAITLTWGLLGPIMALVRPLASLFISLGAAAMSIAAATDSHDDDEDIDHAPACELDQQHDEDDYHVVGWSGLSASMRQALRGQGKLQNQDAPSADAGSEQAPLASEKAAVVPLKQLVSDANRYAFGELLDDIAIWLFLGIVAAGLIAALVPAAWLSQLPGGQLSSMLLVLLLSLPLYACAVESTPLAASLILKGLSPGAALVFLLAGPASNITSLVLLRQQFGRRFLVLYLTAVGSLAVLSGLALDAFLQWTGWTIVPQLAAVQNGLLWQIFSYASAVFLLLMLMRSWWHVSWRSEWTKSREWLLAWLAMIALASSQKSLGQVSQPVAGRILWGRMLSVLVAGSLAFYLFSGFQQIPLGSEGFLLRFGQLQQQGLKPGLHFHWPWPAERIKVFAVGAVHKRDIGFRSDLKKLSTWKTRPLDQGAQSWHSFFTNMGKAPHESRYLLGDQTQVEMKVSLHYRVDDPLSFYMGLDQGDELVALCAESTLRQKLASADIEDLLTTDRIVIQPQVKKQVQACLSVQKAGVKILGLYLVDMHPPSEVVAAFRDVASASVDVETRVHQAYAKRAQALPRARAQSLTTEAQARAQAKELLATAQGQGQSFLLRAKAQHRQAQAARFRLRLETLERILPGRSKLVAPRQVSAAGTLRMWMSNSPWAQRSLLPTR